MFIITKFDNNKLLTEKKKTNSDKKIRERAEKTLN